MNDYEDIASALRQLIRQLIEEMRAMRQQAAELHADHMKKADEADERRMRSADADTDKRILAQRADMEEYTVRIGAVLQAQDTARKEMQEEIDELRGMMAARASRSS